MRIARSLTLAVSLLALAGCSREDAYGVSAMTRTLKEPDPNNRYMAAELLGKYGADAAVAIPELRQALHDENGMVRMGVVYALAEIGPEAKETIPDLEEILKKDPEKDVRVGAAYTLGTFGGGASRSLSLLREVATSDSDEAVRSQCNRVIKLIEAKAPGAGRK